MKESKTYYRTVVISDVHLGSKGSRAKEANQFLKQLVCDKLILNGDIIDGWQLKKSGISWKKKHTAFFKTIIKMIDDYSTKVVYLRGNHDDFLDAIVPFQLGRHFTICQDYIIKSGSKKYYITHGDIFDTITTNLQWLAHIGDIGYTFLLWLNKFYNQFRAWRGKPYYSLSQAIKSKVKLAVNYVSNFETQLADLARSKGCDGIICGHIHQPIIRDIDGINYMNSGDWVESLSALVEDKDGNWKLLYYEAKNDNEHDDFEPLETTNYDIATLLQKELHELELK